MRFNYVIAFSASIIGLVAMGCSAAPVSTGETSQEQNPNGPAGGGKTSSSGGTTSGGTSSGGTSSGGTSSGSSGASSGGSSGEPAGACGAKAGQDACYECCETLTPEIEAAVAAEEKLDLQWQQCACAAARCAAACATDYCTMDPSDDATPGSACEACLDDNTDDCDAQTDADYEKLESSPGYLAWEKCDADSKCESKP